MEETALLTLGLSKDQIKIYQSLLTVGPQSASGLAKSTGIKRTYIYALTNSLIKLGLANLGQDKKTAYFTPASPQLLLDLAQSKRTNILQAMSSLETMLPEMNQLYRSHQDRPVITHFEGMEGVKKVYLDTLEYPNSTILALVQTTNIYEPLHQWIEQEYVRRRVEKHIHVQAIISSGEHTATYQAENKANLRETHVIDSRLFPIPNEINLYGDSKVAIISHNPDKPLQGIIIDHPAIFTTFESWFRLTLKSLPHSKEV